VRVTQQERFERRIKTWFHPNKYRRCNYCKDDVRDEPMHYMDVYEAGMPFGCGNYREYLCNTCADTFERACQLWEAERLRS
jgi:hypothetical protein